MNANQIKSYVSSLKPTIGGLFLYYCLPVRKKVVKDNMQIVFRGVLTTKEIDKLAKAFYSHIFTTLKEIFLMSFSSWKKIKSKVEFVGHEHLLNLADKNLKTAVQDDEVMQDFESGSFLMGGDHSQKVKAPPIKSGSGSKDCVNSSSSTAVFRFKGALVITGHFGNCELAPIAGVMNMPQYRGYFHFIRRNIVNKFIEKLFFRRYFQAGIGIIPKKNSLNKICSVLENQGIVVFAMDQHASPIRKDGILVDFFGKKAGTFKSPAIIARSMNVPVIPGRSYRRSDGKHILEFFAPLPWIASDNKEEEILLNTRQYNAVLEKLILEYPDQWFWMHRRWKNT